MDPKMWKTAHRRAPRTTQPIDDIAELFRKAGQGDTRGVAEMLQFRPDLARYRTDAGLSILRFARYMEAGAQCVRLALEFDGLQRSECVAVI